MHKLYPFVRPLLFALPPEVAHTFALKTLAIFQDFFAAHRVLVKPESAVELCGLRFAHPLGLAAGLDKNGCYLDALGALGFSFIEVGTLTPRPQIGNPKPRLFRIPTAQALINRLGFNNLGIDHALVRLQQRDSFDGILGINIGKNKDTPNSEAVNDYLYCFNNAYEHADYITINISSPNTPNLRDLQHAQTLSALLEPLKQAQHRLDKKFSKYVPIMLKLSPDLSTLELEQIADVCLALEIDAVIATNTTNARDGVHNLEHHQEIGGLSGLPLRQKSNEVLTALHQYLGNKIPLIGVGGVNGFSSYQKKLRSGASLVQLYTGLIYQGPAMIKEIIESMALEL